MRIDPKRLTGHLEASLAPIYLVFGDEPLLIEEACDAIRKAARINGYGDRTVVTVEPKFNWKLLAETAQSLSLFSTRQIVELRMPSGRPGDAGAKALAEYALKSLEETLLLVVSGKLDKAAHKSRWFKTIDAAGVTVACSPVTEHDLPSWIMQRMRQCDLQPEPGVISVLVHYLQGNLLAVAQEIEKLKLTCPNGRVTVEDVQISIADNARFDVYGLVDTCLLGDARKAVRVLGGLQAEGIRPTLVLWAMGREVRTLLRLSAVLPPGRPPEPILKGHGVWTKRIPAVAAALERLRYPQWLALLRQMAALDRILKGRQPGDIWQELEQLSLSLCGIRAIQH